MQAAYYASRINYATALGCSSFPCDKYLYPPASPGGSVTWATSADWSAALAVLKAQAEREYMLEELLMQVGLLLL